MGITVSLAVSIFLLGAAVGALLTRLQWIAFRQKASEEMMERLGFVLSGLPVIRANKIKGTARHE
jgi:DNA-binding transcriptional regulator of glucitol operon